MCGRHVADIVVVGVVVSVVVVVGVVVVVFGAVAVVTYADACLIRPVDCASCCVVCMFESRGCVQLLFLIYAVLQARAKTTAIAKPRKMADVVTLEDAQVQVSLMLIQITDLSQGDKPWLLSWRDQLLNLVTSFTAHQKMLVGCGLTNDAFDATESQEMLSQARPLVSKCSAVHLAALDEINTGGNTN